MRRCTTSSQHRQCRQLAEKEVRTYPWRRSAVISRLWPLHGSCGRWQSMRRWSRVLHAVSPGGTWARRQLAGTAGRPDSSPAESTPRHTLSQVSTSQGKGHRNSYLSQTSYCASTLASSLNHNTVLSGSTAICERKISTQMKHVTLRTVSTTWWRNREIGINISYSVYCDFPQSVQSNADTVS